MTRSRSRDFKYQAPNGAGRSQVVPSISTTDRTRVLLAYGMSYHEIAALVELPEATVEALAREANARKANRENQLVSQLATEALSENKKQFEQQTQALKDLTEQVAEIISNMYNGPVEEIKHLIPALSSFNASEIKALEERLSSGDLKRWLSEPSSPETKPTVLASGWVATQSLPPDVAAAVRTAGAIRQRAYRSKMSETEKAEERAKAAARMRAKRSRSPEP